MATQMRRMGGLVASASMALVAGLACASEPPATPQAPSTPTASDTPAAKGPHPIITEVLYAVPTGPAGDANQDGTRHATGDEFIELFNPHDVPINLKGYRITDGQPTSGPGATDSRGAGRRNRTNPQPANPSATPPATPPSDAGGESTPAGPGVARPRDGSGARRGSGSAGDDSRLDFTFPELVLQPGEVVVLFNGFGGAPKGPVGTSQRAAEKNPNFHNAYVFSIGATSMYAALSNREDVVLLRASDGSVVECVRWGAARDGTADKRLPAGVSRAETLPESKGSVQRRAKGGSFFAHDEIDGELLSPGWFEAK